MKMLERECQVCGAKWRYYTDSSEEEDKIKASSQPCGHQGLSTFTEVELVVDKDCKLCWGRGRMRIIEGKNRKIVPCRCLRRKKDETNKTKLPDTIHSKATPNTPGGDR